MKSTLKKSPPGTSPVAHVIKKSRVESARFETADPSLLAQPMRVPKKMVSSDAVAAPDDEVVRARRLFRGGDASVAPAPFEIFTENLDRIPLAAAEEPVGESAPTMEELERRWESRLNIEVERAREQGFQEGVAAAQAELQEQLDEAVRGFAEDVNAIQRAWESHIRRNEPHLVQLAFRIARAVLDAPLPDEVRQVSESAISDAVERMANGISVEVILHPLSYLRMQESGIEDRLSLMHSKIRWRTNPEMKQNEWIVQSSRSTTRRLEAELLDQIQRDLTMRDMQRENETAEEAE